MIVAIAVIAVSAAIAAYAVALWLDAPSH